MSTATVNNKLVITHCLLLEGRFSALSQEGTSGQKLLSVFVDHKAPSAPTARPELLLRSISEKTCQ